MVSVDVKHHVYYYFMRLWSKGSNPFFLSNRQIVFKTDRMIVYTQVVIVDVSASLCLLLFIAVI